MIAANCIYRRTRAQRLQLLALLQNPRNIGYSYLNNFIILHLKTLVSERNVEQNQGCMLFYVSVTFI